MYLALFLIAILYVSLQKEGRRQPFWGYAAVMTVIVCFPFTRFLLLQYFQNYYAPEALYWFLPVFGVTAFVIMEIYGKQWEKWKKRLMMPLICLLLLLCGHLSGSVQPLQDASWDEEQEEVYELILEQAKDREILLAAPRKLMESARAYNGELLTVYGRDIWEAELDYAFYDGYEDWAYELAQFMDEPVEEHREEVLDRLAQSGATWVVFDKENLTFDDKMQYPSVLECEGMHLRRMNETRHYVIYSVEA